MERDKNTKRVSTETQTLSPQQQSWVRYWDQWTNAALRAGDIKGACRFMLNSISVIDGKKVPPCNAPERPSCSISFENPDSYKTVIYTWGNKNK